MTEVGIISYTKVRDLEEQERERQQQENEVRDEPLTTDAPALTDLSAVSADQTPNTSTLMNRSINVDEAIERLGMGSFQLIVLTAAGLCFAADAMQVLLLTFLSEILRSEWNLSDDETAMITSILFIGAIFGTLTLGPMADKKGRKPVFLLAASIISCFGLAVSMVNSYWALLGNLFMVGWGVGGLTGELFRVLIFCTNST